MTDNTTTDEHVHKPQNNSELSVDDLNISAIVLKEYQPFIKGEYYFIIGINYKESLYFECKLEDKFYKLIILKKNICLINDKFQSCKNIEEIYNLILDSINKNQINITNLKNNKIKFILTITIDDTPSPFELILKEEKNKNIVLLNDVNDNDQNDMKETEKKAKKNDFILIKDNDINSEPKNEKNVSILNDEELQEINNEVPIKDNHNIEFNILEDAMNNGPNKNIKNKKNLNKLENEIEEGEDNDDKSDTTNKEKEINIIYKTINELKGDIKYLKSLIDNDEQNKNDEKIKELEKKNDDIILELTKIKEELKNVLEENKKNKEEIDFLKSNFLTARLSSNIEINNTDNRNSIKDLIDIPHSNKQLLRIMNYDDINDFPKSSSRKIIKKRKKVKSKSQRKILRNYSNFEDENNVNVFVFKQKYRITENEYDLDLTNRKIGDKGLEALSQINFRELKTLSLDTNGIFTIKPLINMSLNYLKVLNLDNNNISDINFLEFVKLPSLEILWLNNNNISDISVLEKVKFNQLQHLYLNNNNIIDISIFQKVFLNRLERLYLKNNRIEDISCLVNVDMHKLQLIYLNKNKIDFNLNINKDIIKKLKKKIKYFYY